MKYHAQVKAPAGNWVDSYGSDDKTGVLKHAERQSSTEATNWMRSQVRVVERFDIVIWPTDEQLEDRRVTTEDAISLACQLLKEHGAERLAHKVYEYAQRNIPNVPIAPALYKEEA